MIFIYEYFMKKLLNSFYQVVKYKVIENLTITNTIYIIKR